MSTPGTLLADFFVVGRSRSKGSLKVITPRGKKPILIEDHAHSKPWRTRMVNEIKKSVPGVARLDHVPYPGPVAVYACFVFERTGETALASAHPTVNAGVNANGDLDKLARNLLDALKDAKVIKDDSLVCRLIVDKQWIGEFTDPRAGVRCMVRAM